MSHPAPNPSYYDNVNLDLLRWIPLGARRVLELGCGEGALSAAYKMRNPAAEYVAVESHPSAAAVARPRVDRLIEADFMSLTPEQLDALGRFDAIVLGDVLEHLPDPWRALKTLGDLLSPQGRVALSVANVSHWTALACLMSGAWPAADSGIFNRTHLRFFTLDSLKKMLEQSGYSMERSRPRIVVGDPKAADHWIPILAAAAEQAGQDRAAFTQRAQTLQYVATAHHADMVPADRLHIHFAALAPDFMDVRTRLPAEALESDSTLTISYREKSAALPQLPKAAPKVAILQRLLMREEEHWRNYVADAREKGWLVVYEIDDHPDLIGRVQRAGGMSAQLRAGITRGCHAVQTSTPALGEVLGALNPEVAVFQNVVMDLPPHRPRDGVRRVFYGALNREGFSSRVAAELGPAIAAHPDLEFVVVHDGAFFAALPTDRKRFLPASAYNDYLAAMASCDVVLSPLEGTEGELYKSDVKFIEAARCGAVMIASPCVYEHAIRDGVDGLIARDLSDWSRHLQALAVDPARLNRLAGAAWEQVRSHRMMAQQVAQRRAWYWSLHERAAELDRALRARWPVLEAG